jgi:AcrR family transcriptional regulator
VGVKQENYMRISELARRSGMPKSTIHFYLRKGLLHAPVKTGHTMAYYDGGHLERLKAIKKMKMDMRMPIAFIKGRIAEMENIQKRHETGSSSYSENGFSKGPRYERKQEIIDAAIRVFSTKGYHRAKVRDITEALGISTGTFYIYFANKRELFMEVVDDVLRTILGDAAKAIKEEKDLLRRWNLRGRAFYENYMKYNEILTQLRAETAGEDQWPQEKTKKIYHELTGPLIREAQQAMEQGLIREVDPDLLGYAITGLIEIMSFRTTLDQKYSFEEIIAFINDLIEKGVAPTSSSI